MSEFFKEASGRLSSMRLMFIVGVIVVFAMWICSVLWSFTLPDIPPGVIALLGLLIGGKVGQRYAEKREAQ